MTPAVVGAQTATQLCDGQPVTISGTPGDDVLTGTAGNDVFFAAQGNDIIWGLGGDDIICAGQGDDVLIGGQGFDVLFGAQGNDVLFAADGSSEADRADTSGSRMFGGAGNDLIVGSNRWDRMQGGLGVDNLAGYEGRDWMRGGGDTDYLDGGGNVDDMHGGNGHDRMRSTTGDSVRGSNGNDLCELLGEPERLVSCTADPSAYATARTLPVVPPNEAGGSQVFEYAQAMLNVRNTVKFDEIFAACANRSSIATEETNEFYDEQYGSNWRVDFRVLNTNQISGRKATLGFREVVLVANSVVDTLDYDLPVVYENGAWRAIGGFC